MKSGQSDCNETTLKIPPTEEAAVDRADRESLDRLRNRMDHLEDKVEHLARLVRGNGDEGILGQLLLLNERVALLRGQWKWVVGLLAGLLVATVGRALVAG